jgi:integrase
MSLPSKRIIVASVVGLVSEIVPVPGLLGAALVFPQGIEGNYGYTYLALAIVLNFALFFGVSYYLFKTQDFKLRHYQNFWTLAVMHFPLCTRCAIEVDAEDDLRRTCAKLCHKSGDDLEQIKFLLGHSSIETTDRYLGSEQKIAIAVNDSLGL